MPRRESRNRADRFHREKRDALYELTGLRVNAGVEREVLLKLSDNIGPQLLRGTNLEFKEHQLIVRAHGGEIPFEAKKLGLKAVPNRIRNDWVLLAGDYRLDLWVRPSATASLRKYTKRGCDAEVHHGWDRTDPGQPRRHRRSKRTLFRGTVAQCLEWVTQTFITWDATKRLGGFPEPTEYLP